MMSNHPMPRKLPSDHAERRRAVKELDTTFLVEAAAGTGKTTILVERIMGLLRSGRAALPEIAAITFTEKAAGELKLRLREGIEKAIRTAATAETTETDRTTKGTKDGKNGKDTKNGNDGKDGNGLGGNGNEEGLLRRALDELQGMKVSTIHKFCSDLLRERPVEAGVEPDFAMADELAGRLILEEAWERWLAGQMAGEDPALRRAILAGVDLAGVRSEGGVPGLVEFLVNHRDVADPPRMEPPWDDARFDAAAAEASRRVADLERALIDCMACDDKGAMQIRALTQWARACPGGGFDKSFRWALDRPKCSSTAGNQKGWRKGALPPVKEEFKSLNALLEEICGAAQHRVLHDAVMWLRPFLPAYERAKAEAGVLDFMDLLVRARDMLAGSAAAREHFRAAFKYLLVDEFQDTDPLQAEIVFFLAEEAGAQADSWEKVRLAPGKLFIVGDPKQSIYGFRRADLALYGRVKELIAAQGQMLRLSVNFRTVPEIIGEVNAVFEPLMTGPVEGRYEPDHMALAPYRDEAGAAAVALLPPPDGLDASSFLADDWRNAEAGAIAASVRRMVQSGQTVPDREGGRRPMKYSDVAVLFRATTGLNALEDAFRAHEVPYDASGGKYYYARLEFADLLCVLQAVDNPYDKLSVLGALRSPFFGHADEELLAHLAAGGSFDYRRPTPTGCARLASAMETLRHLHELCRSVPAARVLTEIFERTQALQVYALKPHGPQRVANLLKVQELARALADAQRVTFGALVRRLREMEADPPDEGESPVVEAEDDCVRMMTFHKAKGLEFPVVVLAHLSGHIRAGEGGFMVDRAGRNLHVRLNSMQTAGWDSACEMEADRTEHERRRLFYVAMTRARDLLVLPVGWSRSPKEGFLLYLGDRYSPEAAVPGVERLSTEGLDILRTRNDALCARPTPEDPLPPEALAYLKHRTNWSADLSDRVRLLNGGRRVQTASDALREEAPQIKAPDPFILSRGKTKAPDPFVFGRLVHKLLELSELRMGRLPGMAQAVREARKGGLEEADARRALGLIEKCLSLPILRRAGAAKEAYRETPFTARTEDGLAEGTMDLVFLEVGQAVIVDYKSNAVTAEEAPALAERYRPQARVYADAAEAALGRPVKEVVFVFLQPGVAVAMEGRRC